MFSALSAQARNTSMGGGSGTGIAQILAGDNVTLSNPDNQGRITINASSSTGVSTDTGTLVQFINSTASIQTTKNIEISDSTKSLQTQISGLGGSSEPGFNLYVVTGTARLSNLDSSTSTLTTRLNNLDTSTGTLTTVINSTAARDTTRLNNLDTSTGAITTRASNLDSSTGTLTTAINSTAAVNTTRLNNLDSSTSTLTTAVNSTAAVTTTRLNNLDSSTGTLLSTLKSTAAAINVSINTGTMTFTNSTGRTQNDVGFQFLGSSFPSIDTATMTVTFSTRAYLQIVVYIASSSILSTATLQFNSDANFNYACNRSSGSIAGSSVYISSKQALGIVVLPQTLSSTATARIFLDVAGNSLTLQKGGTYRAVLNLDAGNPPTLVEGAWTWNNTSAAINSVTLRSIPAGPWFTKGSYIAVYGQDY